MADTLRPWEWRKAAGGWFAPSDRSNGRPFHACDVNDNLACAPSMGLAATCEQPTEGSRLCPDCIEVVKVLPAGRDRKTYDSDGRLIL